MCLFISLSFLLPNALKFPHRQASASNNENKGLLWEKRKSEGVCKKVSLERQEAQEIYDTKKAQEAHEDHSRVPRNEHGHAL